MEIKAFSPGAEFWLDPNPCSQHQWSCALPTDTKSVARFAILKSTQYHEILLDLYYSLVVNGSFPELQHSTHNPPIEGSNPAREIMGKE